MERIWLDHYPPGVPPDIDPSVFPSVSAMFATMVARHGDRPAFTNMGTTLTYRQLGELAYGFGAWLQRHVGLAPGERVAIMLPNVLQHPVVTFGTLAAGGVVVNVNPMYTARELAAQLTDTGARVVVILENFAHRLAEVIETTAVRHVVVTGAGDLLALPRRMMTHLAVRYVKRAVPPYRLPQAVALRDALASVPAGALAPPELGHQDLAFLQPTGGTTGRIKSAMLSHGNIVANVEQIHAWMRPWRDETGEVVITALPLYHIFALTANCMAYVRAGGLNVLVTDPRDLPAFVRTLASVRFTGITGVNTMFNALLNTPGFAELDFSSLKMALGGGMAVQPAVAERWKRVTGTTLVEAYGLTETSPAVCMNPLDLQEYNGKIGLPIPSTWCAVRDDAGHDLPIGEAGELCVRGPQVMRGYWNRPDETRAVLDEEGWLRTGDVARMDARGYFEIVDRKKDVIIVSGFNVYPNEVEEVVVAHPLVLEAAAIGVPDERSGEAVKVFVVPRSGDLDAAEILTWCRKHLTAYKVPKHVELRESLPKSPVGKILRRALR